MISHNRKFIYFEYPKAASSALKTAILPFIIHREDYKSYGSYIRERLKVYSKQFSVKDMWKCGVGDETWRRKKPSIHFIGDSTLPIYRDYFKFSFVRNPYDKIVSAYHTPWVHSVNESFRDFALSLKPGGKRYCVDLLNRELNHMVPWTRMFDARELDFIGRFENIENDIQYIFKNIRIPYCKLRVVNKSARKKNYRNYYDEETKHIVTELFKEDLEYFNYSF